MKKKPDWLLIINIVVLLALAAGFVSMQFLKPFELIGEPEMSVELGDEFVDPGVSSDRAEVNGEVDTSKEGDYIIEYTLGDKTLSRTVHVVNSSNLVLGLKGSQHQIVLEGNEYLEGGAFAIDKRSGAIDEDEINISGKVDTTNPGTYKIKYKVSSGGVTKEATRKVDVVSKDDFGNKAEAVPVLMYHWIYTKNDVPDNLDGNWILNTELEKQLKYLADNDYYFPSFAELRAWVNGDIELPEKSIILTFDDGKEAFLKYGKPLFEKYEVPVTSFMIGWDKNKAGKKVKEYASEYIQFQNHTYALHQAGTVAGYRGIIANKTEAEIAADLEKCRKIIKNNDAMAYPYGDCTEDALKAIDEQGISCAFTTAIDKVRRGQDCRKLPRVRIFGDSSFESWKNNIK